MASGNLVESHTIVKRYWFLNLLFGKGPTQSNITLLNLFYLFIWGFYVAFNTVQVISRWVVGRAEDTSTYSLLGLCTVNCRPMASNYQLSHLRPSWGSNPGLRGGRRECYHSATMAPTLLNDSSNAGMGVRGATRIFWFGFLPILKHSAKFEANRNVWLSCYRFY